MVTRVYQKLREAIYHLAELEGGKLKGEIELDEAYFGGKRKGKRGRGVAKKSVVFGFLDTGLYPSSRTINGSRINKSHPF